MAHCLGFQERFSEPVTPGTRFQGRRQNSSFSRFLAVFVGYSTLFRVPGTISEPVTPGTRFQGRRQNSTFSRFLAVFVGYSTLFRVPGTIFGARVPRYTVSRATSKLIVFAFSGRFRGL